MATVPTGQLCWMTMIARVTDLGPVQSHEVTLKRQPTQHRCCLKRNTKKKRDAGLAQFIPAEAPCPHGTHVQITGNVKPIYWGEISPYRQRKRENVLPKRGPAAGNNRRWRFRIEGQAAIDTLTKAHAEQSLVAVEGQLAGASVLLLGDARIVTAQEAVGAIHRQAMESESG